MSQFSGKLALVTGGAKNVGKVIAGELAARGAHVLLNYFHSHDAALATKSELEAQGAKVDLLRASVAQRHQVDRMFAEIRECYGYLDILVNNAASGALVAVEDVSEESLDKAFNTNFKGSLWCSRAAAPLMESRGGGAIVNISSLGGAQFVMANYLSCGPAKAAVETLTRYLAAEFARLNVRVNTASAGMLESQVADSFPDAAAMQEVVIQSTPMGRLGQAGDLARVVAFLASEDARWITGQVVLADGGLSLGTTLLSPPKKPARSISIPAPAAKPEIRLVEEVPADDSEEIAIVGMGLVVPGANDPEQYWRILSEGGDFFIDVPKDRWDNSYFLSPDHSAEDKTYQNKSAFVTDFQPCAEMNQTAGAPVESQEFTTTWLRHSILQALRTVRRDPADRFALIAGYTADGSQHLEESAVLSGTVARCSSAADGLNLSRSERAALLEQIKATLELRYARSVSSPSRFLPEGVGRNAIKGVLPESTEVLMVDTACSSSLYAIDIGIKGLLMGKHDIAVCGGAFALAPRGSVLFAKLHGISTSGEVRALDKASDGVLFADGAGVVVLKKLSRALRDGDRVLALVKGFGASSDGRGKAIYAPSSAGQTIAIERALSRPGVNAETIDWIIAHATGTPAGDLAEFTTLRTTMSSERPVYVTSNKSLIGHTGWAAGVVSVIQAILGLQNEVIPPQHRFREAPAAFEIEKSSLRIPAEAIPWPRRGTLPRAVSISGFGFGGTNAHLVVEEYDPQTLPARAPSRPSSSRGWEERIAIVGWSAHVPGLARRDDLSEWLSGHGPEPGESFGNFYPAPAFDKVRMPPGTVRTVDRCQLMILECAHDLKAQVGEFWNKSRVNSGVFIGHLGATRNAVLYSSRCYLDEIAAVLGSSPSDEMSALLDSLSKETRRLVPPSNEDSFPGSMPNVIPARIANHFDLKGPNMTVDTGLSSTFSAIEVASRYLRANEVEMTLAGGINGNTTPEMQHIVRDMNLPAGTILAEGSFLFALVTETTARRNGLKILGFLDEHLREDEHLKEDGQASSWFGRSASYNYLGAQGALSILRSLHRKQSPSEDVADKQRAAAIHQLNDDREYAPGAAVSIKRHVAKLKDVAAVNVRNPIEFLPPRTLLITDRPDLLDHLENAPQGLYILSTQPFADRGRPGLYLSSIDPQAVSDAIGKAGFSIGHLRLLTSMHASSNTDRLSDAHSLTALHDLAFLALKSTYQELTASNGSFISLFLDSISSGTLHPFVGLFSGMVKCASLEMSGCAVFALFSDHTDASKGAGQAFRESAAARFLPVVVYEGDRRKAMVLEEEAAVMPADTPMRITSDSVVVAIAGARGITAEILKATAEFFRPTLYLVGSNPIDQYPADTFAGTDEEFAARRQHYLREQRALHPGKKLGAIDKEFNRMTDARTARRNVQEMEKHCGAGRVHYLACDVLDRARLQAAFDEIVAKEGRIDLLINAAGLNRSAPIATKSFDEFRSIRDLKLKGYLNLKSALAGRSPGTWCNFGSLLGFTGQIGEVDYASGNDFLATAACYSSQALGADEYTLGWTLWGSVGLGANPLTKAYFEKAGMYSNMSTGEGIHHFLRELQQSPHRPSTVHIGAAERAAIDRLIPGFFETRANAEQAGERPFYLGRVISSGSDEMVFERVFDLETDSYLQHHIVNGYATLPGMFVTEIAAEAAARLMPDLEVTGFENIEFLHFLRVYGSKKPSPKKIRATVVERSSERTVVKIRITADVIAPNGNVLVRDKSHFELDVILGSRMPAAPWWEPWDAHGEVAAPDPYHFPQAPVLLTGMFASTVNTRLNPLGKRADYKVAMAAGDPVFSAFRVPCILLDGLARIGVLTVSGEYLPLVAPRTIRRIDLYEKTNDSVLTGSPGIQLYSTPREFTLVPESGANRFVATRPDGRIILQIKDVTGVLLGYVHRTSGRYRTSAEMESLNPVETLELQKA